VHFATPKLVELRVETLVYSLGPKVFSMAHEGLPNTVMTRAPGFAQGPLQTGLGRIQAQSKDTLAQCTVITLYRDCYRKAKKRPVLRAAFFEPPC
jgi:hypothetical protein